MTNPFSLWARQSEAYIARPRVRLDAILVLDLEATTYADRPRDAIRDIIQIGICELNLAKGNVSWSDSILVRPSSSEVTAFCTKLTGITAAQAAAGYPFVEACEWLKDRCRAHSLAWASFGNFDRAQFLVQCEREGIEYPFSAEHLNIKLLAALRFGWLREKSLKGALAALGLHFEGTPHNALYDALNAAQILSRVLRP